MKIQHPIHLNSQNLEGLYLWKYLDLFKLIDLITTGEIYFQRFDKFEDGLEGLTGETVHLMSITQGNPLSIDNNKKSYSPEEKEIINLENNNSRKK